MYKEKIVCVIIIIVIFSLDFITQNYTKKVVNEIKLNLEELREELKKKDNMKNNLNEKINDLYNQWMKYNFKLAFYIEHDELEKVKTNFISCKSYIESEEYIEALNELDKTVFVLEHIVDKNKFSLENIF